MRNPLIRDGRQLLAAPADLNGYLWQRRAAEAQARRLMVIRAPDIAELIERPLLEFLDCFARRGRMRHKSILA